MSDKQFLFAWPVAEGLLKVENKLTRCVKTLPNNEQPLCPQFSYAEVNAKRTRLAYKLLNLSVHMNFYFIARPSARADDL